ncbi:hypothetical protein P3L10_026820 [Capsicum annuum]
MIKKMNDYEDALLTLSLSIDSLPLKLGAPPLSLSSPPPPFFSNVNNEGARTRVGLTHARNRRTSTQSIKQGKSEVITPPYPWMTSRRAIVHTLDYLISNKITIISGEVQCKKCEQQYQIKFDLQEKFKEIAAFILRTRSLMHDRAPIIWMNPNLPNCKYCNQINCVKPIISEKRSINWLFLLLGQTIGCCKINELKYFCRHTRNHRTGAKDRLVYLTYMELCKQLDPSGPF